jgi:hypothetical protein
MFDRITIVAAYYLLASRYHSGQASRGYAKLSQCSRMGFRPGISLETDPDVRACAALILWKRRREIRRTW